MCEHTQTYTLHTLYEYTCITHKCINTHITHKCMHTQSHTTHKVLIYTDTHTARKYMNVCTGTQAHTTHIHEHTHTTHTYMSKRTLTNHTNAYICTNRDWHRLSLHYTQLSLHWLSCRLTVCWLVWAQEPQRYAICNHSHSQEHTLEKVNTHSERAWLEVPGVVFGLILQLAEAAPCCSFCGRGSHSSEATSSGAGFPAKQML